MNEWMDEDRPPNRLTEEEKIQVAVQAAKHVQAVEFAKANPGKPALFGGLLYGRDGKAVAYMFEASNLTAATEIGEWVVRLGGLVVE